MYISIYYNLYLKNTILACIRMFQFKLHYRNVNFKKCFVNDKLRVKYLP